MSILAKNVHSDLVAVIEALQPDSSADDVLRSIVGWVQRNQKAMEESPFSEYGFSLMVELIGCVDSYKAIQFDSRAVDRLKSWASRSRRSDATGVAQYVRDLMEELLAPEVEENCVVCGEQDVRGYAGELSSRLICQCQTLGHLRYADGSPVSGEGIRFMDAKERANFGFID